MSLKQEIETWVSALGHYDNNEFDEALKTFENISDTSKILFNCGVIHATLGEHEKAVECYQQAVRLDNYLAVAYFQQGVSNFLMGDFEEALANFNDTLLYLRGNNNIDYEQLGLKFKLYSCEVLFNRGLCYIYLQQTDAGMQDLQFAAKEKVVPDHDVIDEAIREQAEGYTVFSIPVGIVYRPNEAKVKNLKAKDYLGKAKLVAASDSTNAFTGFAGTEIKKLVEAASTAKDDRPDEKISYAATNLVKPNLQSRARQQSAPPLNRNVFPPTPPPENDRPAGGMSRAQSVRGGGPKPQPLDLGRAAFDQSNRPRPGNARSASEAPRAREREDPRDRYNNRRIVSDDSSNGGYEDDLVDMYNNPRQSAYTNRSRNQRPMESVQEFVDDAEFEMVMPQKSRAQVERLSARSAPPQLPVKHEVVRVISEHQKKDKLVCLVPVDASWKAFENSIRAKRGPQWRNQPFDMLLRPEGITIVDDNDVECAIEDAISAWEQERVGKPTIRVELILPGEVSAYE